MCLHINLKYDRTESKIHVNEDGSKEPYDCKIYVCEICKNEFEMIGE